MTIPLGLYGAARPVSSGGDLPYVDDFTVAADLDTYYDTAVLAKTSVGSASGSGTASFSSTEGSAYATVPGLSQADVDVSLFGAGNTQVRRHWLIAARVQPGYTLGGQSSNGVISSGYEIKVENDTNLLRLCRNGTSLASTAFTPSGTFGVRLRVVGGSVKARAWLTSGAEPSAWSIDITDPEPLAAGTAGFGCFNTTNRAVTFNAPFTVAGA